jgi:hypothetical protein
MKRRGTMRHDYVGMVLNKFWPWSALKRELFSHTSPQRTLKLSKVIHEVRPVAVDDDDDRLQRTPHNDNRLTWPSLNLPDPEPISQPHTDNVSHCKNFFDKNINGDRDANNSD